MEIPIIDAAIFRRLCSVFDRSIASLAVFMFIPPVLVHF